MNSNAKFRIKPEMVLRQESDDWALLYDPNTGTAYGLHPVSAFICRLLDGRHTVEFISGQVSRQFYDVPDDSESDIRDFITDLVNNGLASY